MTPAATKQRTHTLNQTAKAFRKSANRVRAWCNSGCPHDMEGKEYRLDFAEVLEWYAAREVAAALSKASGESRKDRLLDLQIEEQETKNAAARGKLVDADAVRLSWIGMITACKAKLLALPDKIAARIGVPNPRRVSKMIREEITLALKELAGEVANGSR